MNKLSRAEFAKLTYEQRAVWACKVCGNRPDEDGVIEHGRGCYTQSENGGGMSLIDFTDDVHGETQ